MARRISKSASGSFILFDATVTDNYRYMNVRDMQVARKNHNLLLARGNKRTVLSMLADQTTFPIPWGSKHMVGDESAKNTTTVFSAPVLATQHTRQLEFWFEGDLKSAKPTVGTDIDFRFIVTHPFSGKSTNKTTTVTTASPTVDGVVVPVPYSEAGLFHGHNLFYVALQINPEVGSDVEAGVGITSVDNSRKEIVATKLAGANQWEVGTVVYFDDSTIEPRNVTRVDQGGGADDTLTLDRPFASNIPTAANTITAVEAASYWADSFAILETRLSDFNTEHGAI